MSVQSQIDRIVSNITAAFTAIGNKGGTVPASQVSGNLASAIASIPSGGATVRRAEGTFQIGGNDYITIDVGFKPDSVMLYLESYSNSVTINFTEADNKLNGEYNGLMNVGGATPYFFADLYPNRGEEGFGVTLYMLDYSLEYIDDFEPLTLAYVAIKYT